MHVCKRIYELSKTNMKYGDVPGICRITGEESTGIPFEKWVKSTFNDYAYLKPGTIISNEALFCFDEKSEFLMRKTGRDKPQKFRTYSHIVLNDEWYCVTKADKKFIYDAIVAGAEIVSLNDTGQKHILFKHRNGMWQLDELFVVPNIDAFKHIHKLMCDMLRLGFSQTEVISGNYRFDRIELAGLTNWKIIEDEIKKYRGKKLFNFTSWMLFISDEDKENIQKMYDTKKSIKKQQDQNTKG